MTIDNIDNESNQKMTIDYTNLRQLDLNLLIALDALISEVSVTRAANRLNLSQSAMSYSLKRLREILGDEILLRSSGGMEVTPLASQIANRVRQVLLEIQGLLEKESFDPGTANESFCIAMSDYVETSLGVPLLQYLRKNAPDIRIRAISAEKEVALEGLDTNQIDLAIGVFSNLKSWHVKQKLYEEEFVCVVKSDTLNKLSLEEYLQRPHILVSSRDDFRGAVDSILERDYRTSRNVTWSTPHFMVVPFLIANSECVSLLPKRVAERCAKQMGLKLLPPPIEITSFTVSMIWHQRNTGRPKHEWLREQILKI
ncbi:MAG: LysR family transcriptional regulator [Cyanobacteria bacterium P01_A01_bin.84]